jgi:hypothetical protein
MKYRYEAIVQIGNNQTTTEYNNVRQLMKELKICSVVAEKLIHKKGVCYASKWITINRYEIPTKTHESPKIAE